MTSSCQYYRVIIQKKRLKMKTNLKKYDLEEIKRKLFACPERRKMFVYTFDLSYASGEEYLKKYFADCGFRS